jgi:hypothetical protein
MAIGNPTLAIRVCKLESISYFYAAKSNSVVSVCTTFAYKESINIYRDDINVI